MNKILLVCFIIFPLHLFSMDFSKNKISEFITFLHLVKHKEYLQAVEQDNNHFYDIQFTIAMMNKLDKLALYLEVMDMLHQEVGINFNYIDSRWEEFLRMKNIVDPKDYKIHFVNKNEMSDLMKKINKSVFKIEEALNQGIIPKKINEHANTILCFLLKYPQVKRTKDLLEKQFSKE